MPIPDYQTLMLPLLKVAKNKKEYTVKEVVEILAYQFELTEDERTTLLPSGQSFLFSNRVAWARTYLKKAGLLDSPKRGTLSITSRGLTLLKDNPDRIDNKILRNYSEFVEFQNFRREDAEAARSLEVSSETDSDTPEEVIDNASQRIRNSLALEIIDTVRSMSPSFFEKLVVQLLVKMGYGGSIEDAGKAVGKTNDEGIDGTIKEDRLGLDIIYIQAKRWQKGNSVGRPELHKFVGALAGQGAKKGIFITTSTFTKEAKEYTPRNETKMVLIDGEELAQLMIDYNLGVSTQKVYEIKRLDSDYFDEN
ncbi:restriction system protein [Dyadobacter jejuensis]|uniref:Restriction system protein n=1 Tax=Dyadobacter jejuensis TaxID=1082580 RepID=A0A316ADR8_9BACT|nr:restriction endonuclease [Dyadobacter jejuensis]PWJ55916.1 restriction system protein [Dyadobacter jejuensis]